MGVLVSSTRRTHCHTQSLFILFFKHRPKDTKMLPKLSLSYSFQGTFPFISPSLLLQGLLQHATLVFLLSTASQGFLPGDSFLQQVPTTSPLLTPPHITSPRSLVTS